MKKLQTVLLASTALAIAAVASPVLAIGVTESTPTISDFSLSSITTSFGDGQARGYFTLTNNATGWDVVGFGVGTDPDARTIFSGVTTTRDQWYTAVLATDMFYQDNVTYGSGEGTTYLNPLAPGQTDSSFFWAESFILAADPPYFIDIFNPNTGDSDILNGSLSSVANEVPAPSALSALVMGLLGLAAFVGLRRRKSSPLA